MCLQLRELGATCKSDDFTMKMNSVGYNIKLLLNDVKGKLHINVKFIKFGVIDCKL